MFNGFYNQKRVLLTGHTGFKGGWLAVWLHHLGARVWGLGQPPPTEPSFYQLIDNSTFAGETECDIRNIEPITASIKSFAPQVVFHLAAQPLVRHSYLHPIETFETNALGTANLLEAVRRAELNCAVVVITSDKCYENREWEFAYRESDSLGGHDVYSMSKAASELVAQSWFKSFFLPNPKLGLVATARAGNVIGGGDYAQDRIVPDCIRSLLAGKPLVVRNPGAVRPWQHVLECLSGYLWLGARLALESKGSLLASSFNFGPGPSSRQPVRALVEQLLSEWPGTWEDGSTPGQPHEAKMLALAIEKAGGLLGWHPVWDFEETARQTMVWYRERHVVGNQDMIKFSTGQIDQYTAAASAKGLEWTA